MIFHVHIREVHPQSQSSRRRSLNLPTFFFNSSCGSLDRDSFALTMKKLKQVSRKNVRADGSCFFVGFCTCLVDGENVYKTASKTEFCGKGSARGPRVITQWTQLWVSSQIMMKYERWFNFGRKCALLCWHGAPRSDRESSEYAFMTSAWTDSCGNRQDFFSQLMLCRSFCRKSKKVVRCLHDFLDFLGKSVPSSVKFLGHRDEEWIYIPMG